MSVGSGGGPGAGLAADDRGALEEERDFLLASLRDLEAEHDAGDIDEADYEALRDDYTVRTAAILRALGAEPAGGGAGAPVARPPGTRSVPAPRRATDPTVEALARSRRRWRTGAVVGVVVLLAVLAAWAVTAASGSRVGNQPITGAFAGQNPPGAAATGGSGGAAAVDPRLNQAGQLVQKGKLSDALKLYDQILKERPNDPQALANEGWLIGQAGMAGQRPDLVDQGLAKIEAAEKVDRNYPDPHFFRGALLYQGKGDAAGAVTELRLYLGLVDPSAPQVAAVEQMLNAAIAAAGPNVPPNPNAASTTVGPKPSP